MNNWHPGTVFLRHTAVDGSSYVAEHACWNTERFIACAAASASAAADKQTGAHGSVEVLTREEFEAARPRRTAA